LNSSGKSVLPVYAKAVFSRAHVDNTPSNKTIEVKPRRDVLGIILSSKWFVPYLRFPAPSRPALTGEDK
jgi:hypothetical protein